MKRSSIAFRVQLFVFDPFQANLIWILCHLLIMQVNWLSERERERERERAGIDKVMTCNFRPRPFFDLLFVIRCCRHKRCRWCRLSVVGCLLSVVTTSISTAITYSTYHHPDILFILFLLIFGTFHPIALQWRFYVWEFFYCFPSSSSQSPSPSPLPTNNEQRRQRH